MTRPSFQDYGTYDESAYPELWDGVVGYWAPCLGPTGTRLFDVSRFQLGHAHKHGRGDGLGD